MSTSLLLGAAGAALAIFTGFGAYAGVAFLAGSLLGSLIDPPKVEGPKRSDLRLQRSEYGWTIPWIYGRWRCAPNIIDQTDLIPHKKTEGGKSGPEIETETYSFSCQAYICQRPDRGFIEILQLFADGRLVWEATSGDDPPFILYDGNESQLPDPTFEAINGVGNEPGYRGVVRAVFVDVSATEFGDRIPQYEFVVNTKVGVFPWRVSHFDVQPAGSAPTHRTTSYAAGIITVGDYRGDGRYYEQQYDLDGNQIPNTAYDAALVGGTGGVLHGIDGINGGIDGLFGTGWYYKENFITPLVGGTYTNSGNGGPVYNNGYIFALGGAGLNIGLSRYPATGGVITAATGTQDQEIFLSTTGAGPLSGWILGRTNVQDAVYVWNGTDLILYEYSFDLQTLNRQWDLTALDVSSTIINGAGFTVYETHAGDLILACDRGTAGNKNAGAFYLNADLTSTFVGQVDAIDLFTSTVSLLGKSGYAVVFDGVISLIPPAVPEVLGDVVESINDKGPLRGLLTRDELDNDEVIGYAVGQVMTIRNALEPLRQGWPFDIVEIDYAPVARRRGATDSIITIPDSDLDARVFGEAPGDLLRLVRDREQSTPRMLKIKYNDLDLDYQTGTQNSPLLTTLSEQDTVIDLPIVDTATLALGKAWTLLIAEIIEREHFEWSTTSKYGWLSQCDVVTIQGRVIRIQEYTLSPPGVIKWKGVLHRPSIYTQTAPGAGAIGWSPQTGAGPPVLTELVLLDIPILSQHDSPFGFYAAMGPARDGRWPGATLYKSLDGGITWAPVASSNVASVIGITEDSPGSPVVPGTLAPYGGGDVVDESSVFVRVSDDDAELLSCTAAGLTNGANLCAISRGLSAGSPSTLQWELLQFRDVVQLEPKGFVLTGFLRGRKGTLTTDHDLGDTFVLLPVTNVDAPEAELNVSLKYKAVTFGMANSSGLVQDFINTGKSAEEFFDTEIGHLPTPVNNQTGTTYTLVTGDRNWLVTFDNAAPVTVNLPATMPDGWSCFVENIGAGEVTLDAGGGVIDEGASTLTLQTDQGCLLVAFGGDWFTMRGIGNAGFETQDDGVTVDLTTTVLNAVTPLSAIAATGRTDLVHDLSGVTPGTYGDAVTVPVIAVNEWGHIESVSPTPIVYTGNGNGPNDWMFGLGGDGTAHLDGTATVTWATKVGSVYTMIQVVSLVALTIDNGVTLMTRGFPIWVKNTLTNNGIISTAGLNGVGAAAGVGGGANNLIFGPGTNGGAGGIGNGLNGAAITTPATGGGGIGGVGGAGGATTGGNGGLIALPTGPGGANPAATFGQFSLLLVAMQADLYNILGTLIGGGSGGGAGGGANPNNGGAGGGGGGVMVIFARVIAGNGTITVKGGNGATVAAGNVGGGGGGGGGLMYVTTTSSGYQASMTVTVAGGTHGNGNGTGVNGVDGNAGRLLEFFV